MSKRVYRVNFFSSLAFLLLCVVFIVCLVEHDFILAFLSMVAIACVANIPSDYKGVSREKG